MKREKTYRQRNARWPGYAGFWVLPAAALMLTAVLFLPCCATTKQSREDTRRSSLADVHEGRTTVTRVTLKEPVPADSARLAVALRVIGNLPDGAGYRTRQGRASAEVKREGDELLITATCDSMERMVEMYDSMYVDAVERLTATENELRTEKEKRTNGIKWMPGVFIAGVAAGVVLTIKLRNRYGKRQGL